MKPKPEAKLKLIEEYLKLQGRFRHLTKPENKPLLDELQRTTDKNWEELLKKEELNRQNPDPSLKSA